MKKWLFTLICLLLILPGLAQQRTLRGTVLDDADGHPLPGIQLQIKITNRQAVTQPDGRFLIVAPPGSITLLVSGLGYVSQPVVFARTRDTLTIRLKPDVRTLNEVVVTGYKTEMRREVTGSVSIMRNSDVRSVKSSSGGWGSPGKPATLKTTERTVVYNVPGTVPQQAGQLTAGEIHDYSKWTLWQDIDKTDLGNYRTLWRIAPIERYSVQLVTADNFPVVDVPVRLLDSRRRVVWQTRSDNTGRSELWRSDGLADPTQPGAPTDLTGKLTIEAIVAGKTYVLNRPRQFGKGDNSLTVGPTCEGSASSVDVAFVVDATGSMGDEITYLKAELTDVISRANEAAPGSAIRLGSVFYRDHTDEYLTRFHDFSDQPDSTVAFIKQQRAGGGGDYPEAVDTALHMALKQLSWSPSAKARLLFLVLDAPPHDDEDTKASLQRAVAKAAEMGVRIIPIAASGIDKSTEYLLRTMALSTNGTYVFLTDDSGIGGSHIKPTTDQYTVEKLNNLLVRIISKFTQSPDCKPTNVPVIASTPDPQVRYSEQGQPVGDTTKASSVPRFRFFPNPTRDFLTIESQTAIRELFVTDVTGKVLLRETPARETVRVDMQPYPTGTYLFRFDTGEAWKAGRFLVAK